MPEIGPFFAVGTKVFVTGEPYTEVRSIAGFRTCTTEHPNFWRQLQRTGIVPRDVEYDEVPRGRVTYEDSNRTFTLFADKHIIQSRRLVNSVMHQFGLPSTTKVLPDDHYRCPKCLVKRKTKKQEEDDWDF